MQDAYLTSVRTGRAVGAKSHFNSPSSNTAHIKAPPVSGVKYRGGGQAKPAHYNKGILGAPPKACRLTEAEISEKEQKTSVSGVMKGIPQITNVRKSTCILFGFRNVRALKKNLRMKGKRCQRAL